MAEARTKKYPRPAGRLAGSLLEFDLMTEIEQLRQEPPWQRTGRNAKTLVKQPDFRIVLTVMKGGTRLQEHKAAGRISVQTLTGHLRLHLPAKTAELPSGHLVAIDRALRHDVEALEDSAFLLTVSWPKGTPKRD